MRDITLCHPRLQKLATELIQKCSAQGLQIKIGETREFDSSFFGVLMQILYLSHLRLIFLSNFVIFIVLLCTLCGIIKKTDFIIGEKRYVYIYHWK